MGEDRGFASRTGLNGAEAVDAKRSTRMEVRPRSSDSCSSQEFRC